MASSPAYAKYPDHNVDCMPHAASARAAFGGEVIVESSRCIEVHEGKYPVAIYYPREDARMESLEKTDHTTFCPFKGTASYYTIRADGRTAENAVWSYEDPYDEVAALKDHLAFYTDRLD
jgi:uncharacterized protein (DUF427 family)